MTRQTLLMTRPRAAAERFVAGLAVDALRDVDIIYSPLVNIVAIGDAPDLTDYDGVIFTSANGVAFAPKGQGHAAYCVGKRTARTAQDNGWEVKSVDLNAEGLIARLSTEQPKGRILHLAGQHRRGEIDVQLTAKGIHVDVHVLYDQPLRPLGTDARDVLLGEVPAILPLFSPRTAAHLGRQIKSAPHVIAVVMSDAIAHALKDVQFAEIIGVGAPTGKEMTQCIEMLLQRNRFP